MGRPTNKERAERAAAAANAAAASQETSNLEPAAEESPVAQESEGRAPEPRNEERRLAMEAIEKRQIESDGIQVPEPEEKPAEPDQTATQEAAVEAPKAEDVETPAEPVDPAQTAPTVEMVKVKVDGIEFEVSKAEVDEEGGVKAYQKNLAADHRLREAKEANAQTQRLLAEALARAQPQQPKQPTADEFIAARVDTIRFGTPEESAAALKEIMQIGRVDPEAITAKAIDTINRNNAVKSFGKEFQEIVSNPILLKLANTLKEERAYKAIAETNGNVDWDDFYRKIGNEIISVVGRQYQPSTTATTTNGNTSQVSDKEARKASIVNLPTAQARAVLPKEEKPESREDTLAAMRKMRGIPTG